MAASQTISPRLLFPAAPFGLPDFLPTLRAYSGFRVQEAKPLLEHETLGRIGSLEIKLATTAKHVRLAQKLRYQVFYNELSAARHPMAMFWRRDVDHFDSICDHLVVFDREARGTDDPRKPKVVGTYRLLRQSVAERHGGFYTAGEYDVGGLLAQHRDLKFLELGRSCVLAPYRDRRTVELLWHGVWTYVVRHRIDVMIGCASFEGINPDKLALPLSFLHHHAQAPAGWRVRARSPRYVEMNRLPKKTVDAKSALRALPPLIKGYLRVGAFIGEGAVIDRKFGTTDVFVALPVSAINQRYIEHFGPGAERHAA
jgi:L-ornithine Nalpha-acyltransferase